MSHPEDRDESETERRLRAVLQAAFERAPHLQAAPGFAERLRDELRQAPSRELRSLSLPGLWFMLAACLVLAIGLAGGIFIRRSTALAEALAQDAIGDHRNCALKFRLVRTPMPLEEAAQRFDSAYRLLLSAPPDDIPASGGVARVIERHSCAFGERRFGHVVMQYRGRVVSLLMTAGETSIRAPWSGDAIPQAIGRPVDGLSVVSVSGSHHAIVLVGDLSGAELMQLSSIISLPLVHRLGRFDADRSPMAGPLALLIAPSPGELTPADDK